MTQETDNKYAIAMTTPTDGRRYMYSTRGSGGFCKNLCDAAMFVQHKSAVAAAKNLLQHHAGATCEIVTVAFAEASSEHIALEPPQGFAIMQTAGNLPDWIKLPHYWRRGSWVQNLATAQSFKTREMAQTVLDGIVADLKKRAEEEVTRNAEDLHRYSNYRTMDGKPSTYYRKNLEAFVAQVIEIPKVST